MTRMAMLLALAVGACAPGTMPVNPVDAELPMPTPSEVAARARPVPVRPPAPPEPSTPNPVARSRVPPKPPPLFPLYGVTFHFLAHIYGTPTRQAPVIGYARRGAAFRAAAAVAGDGCPSGWHAIPGGGFVCPELGYILGRTPHTFEPAPAPPAVHDPLPYAYARVIRDGTAQYWTLPTTHVEAVPPVAAGSPARIDAGPDAGPDAGADAEPGRIDAEGHDGGSADASVPDPVRLLMQRGYIVSVDGVETSSAEQTFVRTVRGAYVLEEALTEVEAPPPRGMALGRDLTLPVALVFRRDTRRFARDPVSGRLTETGRVDAGYATHVRTELDLGRRAYVVEDDGHLLRSQRVRIARRVPRPTGVPEDARFIHVDLATQTLVAYDGERPAFAALVSSGRPGFETPSGLFRIESKHISSTMDDLLNEQLEDRYLIEDVPWVQFFEGSYALHGALWHDFFGQVRSHGCVNLSPPDAAWLFRFTDPIVPRGWHGRTRTPGTWVLITPRAPG